MPETRERAGWQPIGTAPSDGTRILIGWEDEVRAAYWDPEFKSEWNEEKSESFYRGAWTDDAVLSFGYEEVQEYEPTHWMPLPDPPTLLSGAPPREGESGTGILRDALEKIANEAPTEEPEYDDWGGDTEEAERWGLAAGAYPLGVIAREALAKADGKGGGK